MISLVAIPGALDRDKTVMVDGHQVGTVMRGWLRSGGEQWVFMAKGVRFGGRNLDEIKREVLRRKLPCISDT